MLQTYGREENSNGRREFPNFGQHMSINYFKCFMAGAPYLFCEEKHWCIDKRDRPWDIFLPCMNNYNEKRRSLIKIVLLMMDESMLGWRPKTSKLGGLPNYAFEPRKPIPLGAMLRNCAECHSGCVVHQDVVQSPEIQSQKKYHADKSFMPDGTPITAHAAEVLRQVEGARVIEDGWVGGDAWFGSLHSSVELIKRLGVNSTFIIKTNKSFFPIY